MDALAHRPMLTKSVTCFVGKGHFFLSLSLSSPRRALHFFLFFLTSFSQPLPLFRFPPPLPIGGVLGDLLAQQTTGLPFDVARNLRLATFGLVFGGPAGHLWHRALDATFVAGRGSGSGASQPRVVLSKLACDQLLFAPVATALLFVFLKITEGGTLVEALAFCAENWWRTLKVKDFIFSFFLSPGRKVFRREQELKNALFHLSPSILFRRKKKNRPTGCCGLQPT